MIIFVKTWCTFLFTPFLFKSFNLFRQFSYTFRLLVFQFVGKKQSFILFMWRSNHIFRKLFRFNPRIRVLVMYIYRTVRMYHVKKSYFYVYFSVEVLRRIKKLMRKVVFAIWFDSRKVPSPVTFSSTRTHAPPILEE